MAKEIHSGSGQTSPPPAGSVKASSSSATASSVSRDNAEHYRWGDDCDGWHLVKDTQLSVIEEFMPRARPRFATTTSAPSNSSTS